MRDYTRAPTPTPMPILPILSRYGRWGGSNLVAEFTTVTLYGSSSNNFQSGGVSLLILSASR